MLKDTITGTGAQGSWVDVYGIVYEEGRREEQNRGQKRNGCRCHDPNPRVGAVTVLRLKSAFRPETRRFPFPLNNLYTSPVPVFAGISVFLVFPVLVNTDQIREADLLFLQSHQ